MMDDPDPLDLVEGLLRRYGVQRPPATGPGSGKAGWQAFARGMASAYADVVQWWVEADTRARRADELAAENERLRERIAARKPKGGRPRLSDARRDAIVADLAGGLSTRQVAARHGVSQTTVCRIKAEVDDRAARIAMH